jgi:glycosyltransferase involved in cell wall biosynthesis
LIEGFKNWSQKKIGYKPMRIGIVPAVNPTGPSGGGVYQYSMTMLRALHEWTNSGCEDEFLVFCREAPKSVLESLNGRRWTFEPLMPEPLPTLQQKILEVLRRIVGEGPHREAWRWLRRQWQLSVQDSDPYAVRSRPDIRQWFRSYGVELMLYTAHTSLPFEAGVPYVMAIHDLQHRLQPEFPEVSANGEWESREYYLRNGARYATLILADSEVGKEDILNFYGPYGVTADRVKVLPYLPASCLAVDVSESERHQVQMKYRLPDRYLFYPAQFWPHKNHARIVQALAVLRQEHNLKIPIVLSGSHTGEIREQTFCEVMSLASQLELEKEIHYLGYVPDEDMSGVYAEAVALVMPTFFGPTNIPILEAWAFGCPVLTSDIRGIREQVQDAAILVDPRSVEAIADGIYRIWTDENLGRMLGERGRQRLATYGPNDYGPRLIEILKEAKARVRSGELRDPNWAQLSECTDLHETR